MNQGAAGSKAMQLDEGPTREADPVVMKRNSARGKGLEVGAALTSKNDGRVMAEQGREAGKRCEIN
jgi:hypothetical protein